MKHITYKVIAIIAFLIGNIAYIHGQELPIENNTSDEVDSFDVTNATNNMQELKGSLDTITKELFSMDDKQRTEDGIPENYKQTRDEVVNVINTIGTTTDNVAKLLKQIAVYKKEIMNANEELKSGRIGSDDTKEHIKEFMNIVYKLDNKLYDDDGETIDDIKLLINSDNIPRTLANDYAVQSMILQLNDLIKNFNDNEKYQLESMRKLNTLKKDAQGKLKEYTLDLEKLQQKKNYLIQFLSLYKGDKLQRQQTISQLFDSTKSVHEKSQELLKDIKKGIYKVGFNIDRKIKELEEIEDESDRYPVARPIYPIYNIQTYFGDLTFQKEYGVPHLGIQIKADQGTPVYAARDGIVYFVADNDEIGINWAMVMHTDGYVSIYEYLNKTIVQPGDIVRRGQLIGYSGGEPGTRGAGFISKGANITFMVFKDAVPMDPFDILDASIVQEKSVLPEGYQIKYLRDKYARAIDITSLSLMTGSTEEERTYQFLKLYGIGVYKNPQFREDATKGTNIDRDVVICIAFAESTLGRYLSTSNNIGNVGNNDRGDRVPMQSTLAGARAIPLTLNNSNLGHYHTINQLSRYGNKDGKIYASSPINWQTNVLKCLSQIKGYYIPEDFPFRVGPNPNLTEEHEQLVEILKTKTFQRK